MTLLDFKSSTIDVDFTIPSCDVKEFEVALKNNQPGYRVDRCTDGRVFCQTLPSDYLEKSVKVKEYRHIVLKALRPVDIIVTKIGPLNERDMQDIEACIKQGQVRAAQIREHRDL